MAITQASSLSVDQQAFDQIAYFALRSEMLFDAAADVQPVAQSMPGSSVTFTIFSELADATSTLSETDRWSRVSTPLCGDPGRPRGGAWLPTPTSLVRHPQG